ncbi:MAG: site-2 protease family protein [Patescibacteria group bacterium]
MNTNLMIFQLVALLLSAIIHEYMHGWTANQLGDDTAKLSGRLTLNPLAHIDIWGSVLMPALIFFSTGGAFIFGYAKPVPFNPYNLRDRKYGSAKVALAGPLSNLFLAALFGLILRVVSAGVISLSLSAVQLIQIVVYINLLLAVFNSLPIPPLDGSKIIMPFLPAGAERVLVGLERYGMFLVLIFVLFGFPLIIPIIDFLFKLIAG